jgi:hypothetical protein
MRKAVTSLFISLDGVVEAEDDWQFAYLGRGDEARAYDRERRRPEYYSSRNRPVPCCAGLRH